MPRIDNFLSHFANHNDYSKASKFDVLIFKPPVLQTLLPDTQDLRFQCETAELPGYNLNTIEGRVYGASYAVAATPVFNELSLTFICAGDLWEKQFFDAWMNFILPRQDFLARYREEYVGTIEVRQYLETPQPNNANSPQISYHARFIEAFPSSISPVALNWGEDGINRLNVTFKYANWTKLSTPFSNVGIATQRF